MPAIKIYPPSKLPDRGITETQFNIWKEELEVYLSQEKDFKVFLTGQKYQTWQSAEINNSRIPELHQTDQTNDARTNNQKIDGIRNNLRTVLSIVGKCVSEGHYNSVIRHSTSLQWIYDMLASDYDIQTHGIHFFHIIETKYDPSKNTPVSFYNQYRTLVVNNLAKAGDIIKYKSNEALEVDEKVTPMLEDMILVNVLREIDSRLPAFIRAHYNHKIKKTERIMDFKSDILINVPSFLELIENKEQNYKN